MTQLHKEQLYLTLPDCFQGFSLGANHRSGAGFTFEGLCGPWRVVLVRVEFQCQFPVGFFQILIGSFSVHSQNFIVILALLYPARGEGSKQ